MQKHETSWRKNGDWKARYTQLYSSRRLFRPQEEEPRRISFMSNDATPYTSLLMRMRTTQRDSSIYGCEIASPPDVSTLLSTQSDMYNSYMSCVRSDDLGGNETLLLDMVRARSRELEDEAQDKTLELPRDDVSDERLNQLSTCRRNDCRIRCESSNVIIGWMAPRLIGFALKCRVAMSHLSSRRLLRNRKFHPWLHRGPFPLTRRAMTGLQIPSSEACVHGLSMRMTERSVSRSRFSRISTRRDMDIPSILAFQTPTVPAPVPLIIPGLQKVDLTPKEDIPRWSIRRSICPVCSQKWRDKSSINNVKYSGLKRNSSAELPSVIAPARLRVSITAAYAPRPFLAAVDETTGFGGVMRNTSAAWQLTRARRFRIPKLQMPPPEATAPPSSTAPMARKDLDIRVNRFLKDEGMTISSSYHLI